MLTAPLLRRRIAFRICAIRDLRILRPCGASRNASNAAKGWPGVKRVPASNGPRKNVVKVKEEEQEASLYEQLFGASSAETGQSQLEEREIPPIPLESPLAYQPPKQLDYYAGSEKSEYQMTIEKEAAEQNQPQISVLVLRNASKHLVEEDFKRLIPQGSHLEGWTLEQGDIVKVIPGRDPITLEQSNFYYLLFSSALSAFTYQGHATRVHRLVASHTPSSILSPMMPPPGITAKNMDVNTAIQSFSLVAPNHQLDLRQLKQPLSPVMQAIVRNKGYPWLVSRKDRMPYEARLTLEGPQVHESAIRHFFYKDGQQRGLSWSGNEKNYPRVTKWQYTEHGARSVPMSAMSKKPAASMWGKSQKTAEARELQWKDAQANEDDINREFASTIWPREPVDDLNTQDGRDGWVVKPQDAFIIGFGTERAMQSFVHYWHRRPMQTEGFEQDQKSDLPPIINVEALW